MKRTLVLGGMAAGLLASAVVASPAQAEKVPVKPLAQTNFAAKQIAAYWFGEKAANLIAATPYNVETKVSSKVVAHMPKAAASTQPGIVGSSGDQKKATGTSKNVNLPRSSGKVFFIGADHKPHWCSATALQSLHKNLVATAGHCVFDTVKGKATLDKWVFIPGYYQGKAPWGIYVGKTATTHFDFSVYNDADYDYAFVTVYNGVAVTDVKTDKVKNWVDNRIFKTKAEAEAAQAKLAKEAGIKAGIKAVLNTAKGKVAPNAEKKYPDTQKAPATLTQIAGPGATGNATMEKAAEDLGGVGDFTYSDGTWGGKVVRVANSVPAGWTKDGKSYTFKKDGATYTATFWALFEVDYKLVGKIVDITLKDVGKLGANVPGQGLAYNQKVGQPTFVFGYPSGSHPDGDHAFTGNTLKYSYGKTFPATAPSIKGDALVGIKSSFSGEGALGSGWLYRYDNSKRFGYLNGVTISVSDTDGNDRYDTSLSPYFDGETLGVYNAAATIDSGAIV